MFAVGFADCKHQISALSPLPVSGRGDLGGIGGKLRRNLILYTVTILALLLAGCGGRATQPSVQTPDAAATSAALTVEARLTEAAAASATPTTEPPTPLPPSATPSPEPTITPTPTATEVADNVKGKVCPPTGASGDIPAMSLFFEDTDKGTAVELPIPAGQTEYKVTLPPGTYLAYAWLNDFSRGGLYSKAVPCGMKTSCEDHAVLPFEVAEGQVVEGIDICDWYAGPFAVPYPPGKEAGDLTGKISGGIDYPDGSPPSLRVVFFNQVTGNWIYVITLAGASSYTSIDLAPGVYNVVAYPEEGQVGGAVDASGELQAVTVKPGETTGGVDITEWRDPGDGFPADPTR